ncbi:MAG: sugar phosphate isomerase/epimerase, partial [Clostridia bacterium]|nr:sugar phosphate isomerase/epimerase [Clostridia bacterium]
RNAMKTAIQMYTLRNEAKNDLEGVLKIVSDAGYDGVELAGRYGKTGDEIKALLDKYGLKAISAHIGLNAAMDKNELAEYKATGIKYAVVPMTPQPTEENRDEILEKLAAAVENLKMAGFIPGYHNHAHEFNTFFDSERWYDIIMKKIPDAMAELDLCWLEVGGGDAAGYIEKYKGRIEILHVKDFVGRGHFTKPDGTAPAVPLADGLDFDQRAVGDGVLDIDKIVKAARKSGTEWLVVELDEPEKDKTAIECAVRSAKALKAAILK